ncbi:hypothetical protein CEXT_809121 [Caerostris extrusa]|uniref:Uncharacterized protein n=1 Tax=Caerostris extrusa TaxID=172846 RepID=A0AAV4TXP4_CAEEX|nr:hypothetical protein CEXT_809121 [Caerostris extrusa]
MIRLTSPLLLPGIFKCFIGLGNGSICIFYCLRVVRVIKLKITREKDVLVVYVSYHGLASLTSSRIKNGRLSFRVNFSRPTIVHCRDGHKETKSSHLQV